MIAEFDGPGSLFHAAEKIRDAGYVSFDTYTPFPIHGMDRAMGQKASHLPWLSLIGGLLGFTIGLALQTWISLDGYALIFSGKPLFSAPAFVPVTFELTILFTAFFTVFGMFGINKLPAWYHSIFNASRFGSVSSHGFFVSIESADAKYDSKETRAFLKSIGGSHIEEVEE